MVTSSVEEAVVIEETNMVVDSEQQPMMSFKDKLLGCGVASSDGNPARNLGRNEGDLEILDGDMNTSMVNGIPAIAFSERIKDILFKEIESTDMEDYNKVLTQGPWIIFGQYHTVQRWTKTFNPAQPYPSVVLAWIHLPGLPGYLYKRKIIEARPETVLEGMEAPTVVISRETVDGGGDGKNNDFGPRMLVERKSWKELRDFRANGVANLDKDPLGSRFTPLIEGNNSRSGLNEAVGVEVARGAEVSSMDVVRPILGSGVSGLVAAEAGLDNGESGSKPMGKRPVRGRGSENKVGNNREGASFNRSFKDKGGRLKNAGISRILLLDAISSMVNLVNSLGGPGSDIIGGRAEGQTGGPDSTPA
ncbi:hypothetical protein GOBAR_AA31300 [Gossypium barbadense]|uniref:Uncharacterized protein n=1 Tax=Gossypium barbadense TaxID=3634 RepID=A0A2P5WE89_GOSBA|nr:hypothetical protein GOBAR_AA31300 [Gossypium barbadense]